MSRLLLLSLLVSLCRSFMTLDDIHRLSCGNLAALHVVPVAQHLLKILDLALFLAVTVHAEDIRSRFVSCSKRPGSCFA